MENLEQHNPATEKKIIYFKSNTGITGYKEIILLIVIKSTSKKILPRTKQHCHVAYFTVYEKGQ